MHSYISSSDNQFIGTESRKEMISKIKILLAGVLIFGSVVSAYYLMINLFEKVIGGGLNARMLTMIDYLPNLTKAAGHKKNVMVFGSSMAQYGFLPTLFDREMKAQGAETATFNYGIANLNPVFQEYITRRIREQFEKKGSKLSLTLVELTPFQMTVSRKKESAYTDDQNLAVLASNSELWKKTLADPSTGLRLFEIRYLRRGYSAELISSLPAIISQVNLYTGLEGYAAAKMRLDSAEAGFNMSLAHDNYPASPLPGWNPLTGGGPIDTALLSDRTLKALSDYNRAIADPVFMEADLKRRILTSDILDLKLDESLIRAFIRMVKNLQAVSEKTEVFLMPRNKVWVDYAPDVQQKLDMLKQRVTLETGAAVRDFQTVPGIGRQHFRDVTHLNSEGTEIFTRFIAQQYAEELIN